MINKIKNNLFMIIICIILIIMGAKDIYRNAEELKKDKEYFDIAYNQCQEGMYSEDYCEYYSKPFKNRDAVSSFAYATLAYNNISKLQILAPLLIIIVSSWNFHKNLRKGLLKNSLTRMSYKDYIKKHYLKCLKYAFILPIFLLIVFIIISIMSGNFDYEHGILRFGTPFFGEENTKYWILFMIVYLFNFVLRGIFWINIGLYNCKHNKNFLITVVVSYVEYNLIFIIMEKIAALLLYNTVFKYYFLLSIAWSFDGVTLPGMLLFSLSLALISGIIVFLSYRSKEKILVEVEK